MSGSVSGFFRQQGVLTCDGVPLDRIAREAGTPVHVYSGAIIDERYRELEAAFASYPHRFHYAIKANATLAIVRRMRSLGANADANSGGEIEVALRAGFTPDEVVFTGVGKTHAELERAVALGLGAINAESPGEVARIAAIAEAQGRRARVAVRINPDVEAGTHPHISTGSRINKFGVSLDDARAMIRDVARRPSLQITGLHAHIGSQIYRLEPFVRTATLVAGFARELMADGNALEHIDLGGGLGIAHEPAQPVVPADRYAAAVIEAVRPTGLHLLLEPGRWIVGPAGVLVTAVVDLKRKAGDGWFVIVDAGMTDLLRPALYGAHHGIEAVEPRDGEARACDVVGPVCETADTFGLQRRLPPLEVGDLLAIRDTGAYGAVMASNYNRRPMAAEVLVDSAARPDDRPGGQPGGREASRPYTLVRRRQTLPELLQWDV
jgi:diaminopimelate decarboxylase